MQFIIGYIHNTIIAHWHSFVGKISNSYNGADTGNGIDNYDKQMIAITLLTMIIKVKIVNLDK